MKKYYILFLIIVLNSAFAVPDVDDSAVLGNDATCDETSLDIIDLSADLHAEWEANTINLKYYTDGTQYGDGYSCSYDGFVEIPESQPSKHGYDFVGWKVRRLEPCVFDFRYHRPVKLAGYSPDVIRWQPIQGTYYGMNHAFGAGITSGLEPGEWARKFDIGEVRGRAACSSSDSKFKESVDGRYCWCKVTDIIGLCYIESQVWFLESPAEGISNCIDYCAWNCANGVEWRWFDF